MKKDKIRQWNSQICWVRYILKLCWNIKASKALETKIMVITISNHLKFYLWQRIPGFFFSLLLSKCLTNHYYTPTNNTLYRKTHIYTYIYSKRYQNYLAPKNGVILIYVMARVRSLSCFMDYLKFLVRFSVVYSFFDLNKDISFLAISISCIINYCINFKRFRTEGVCLHE